VSNITAITDDRLEKDYQVIGNELGITLEESKKFDNTQAFQYDSLYRLTQSSNTDVYGTISHRYDPIGNMVKQIAELNDSDPLMNLGAMTSGGTGGTSGRIGRGPDDPPGPHAITGTKSPDGTAKAFTYDENGNMTHDRDMTLRWDYKDRLKGITKGSTVAAYLYDYTDTRKKKGIQGEADKTVFYVDKNSEVREGELHKYVYVGTNRVARMDLDLSLYFFEFFLHDHIGSTSLGLSSITVVQSEMAHYPFGKSRKESKSLVTQHIPKYKFVGKERDAESCLQYFEARYFRELGGRFISVDPEIIPELLDTQRLNTYTYSNNNPIMMVDNDGKSWGKVIFFCALMAIQTAVDYKELTKPQEKMQSNTPKPVPNDPRHGKGQVQKTLENNKIVKDDIAKRPNAEYSQSSPKNIKGKPGLLGKVGGFLTRIGKIAGTLGTALSIPSDVDQNLKNRNATSLPDSSSLEINKDYGDQSVTYGSNNSNTSIEFGGATIYGDATGGGNGFTVMNDTGEVVK
jgi:RHS repeat-associated protein